MIGGERAYVALGANLGEPVSTLRSALVSLRSMGVVESHSSLYRTEPMGVEPGQPPYLNAVVVLRPWPGLREAHALLAGFMVLERVHGRVRRERWGPRMLDLDLLDLAGVRCDDATVSVPHPRMMDRAFVLAPLCEVAPAWRHPETGESACAALARVGTAGVARTALAWRAR